MAKFENDVDPDGLLLPAERAKRAQYLWTAHFQRLALKSVKSRRRSAELAKDAKAADSELRELEQDGGTQ